MERCPSVSWPRFLSASHKQGKPLIFIKAIDVTKFLTLQIDWVRLVIGRHCKPENGNRNNLCTFSHLIHTVPWIKLTTLLITGFMASASPKPRSRDQFRPSLHRRRHPSESLVKCPNTSLEFNGVLWEPNELNFIFRTPHYQVAFKPGSKISLRSPGSSSPSPWQHLQPSQGDSFQLNYFLLPHWASLFFNILLLHFFKKKVERNGKNSVSRAEWPHEHFPNFAAGLAYFLTRFSNENLVNHSALLI